jgi:hypothetical protein
MKSFRFTSLFVQAIYVFITALQLIFIPNVLLGTFGFAPTQEIWIKVFGIVLISLSLVYYGIVKDGNPEVVKYTFYSRIFVALGFGALVIAGQVEPTLILFAGIDIATAIWTWFELKKSK